MNRQDASARLEALLARVIARKDAPRVARKDAPVATAPTKTPQSPVADDLDDLDSAPEVSLHPPLAGDPGQGPEIDLFERTMDLDISSIEAAVAASADMVTRVEPFVRPPPELLPELLPQIDEPAPTVTVSTPEELPSLDLVSPLEPEPESAPAPTARLSEPDAFMPVAPVAHMIEPAHAPLPGEELRAPTPAPVRVEAPKVEAPPKVEEPLKVEAPKVEAPKVEAPKVERFEPEALPAAAAVVQVVAAAPPAPRTLRELLVRSLALRVRPAKG